MEDSKEKPYETLRFWVRRDDLISDNVESHKWREFLIDKNYSRPTVRPERLISGFMYIYNITEKRVTITDILFLLHVERYEFFTIRSMAELNLIPDVLSKSKLSKTRYFNEKIARLQKLGLLWQPIRNWDLDDQEFKQRFGDHLNRHNYRKRYALNMAGKALLDKLFEFCASD